MFVAHCVLNQNSISDGTACFPGSNEKIVRALLDAKVGIVQMPCPELNCLGLDRDDPAGAQRPVLEENTRIRRALEQAGSQRKLETLVEQVVFQIEEYRKNGFIVLGIIGINRSPSCGVVTTSSGGKEVAGSGVYLEKLRGAFAVRHWDIPVAGVKDGEPEKSEATIRKMLEER